MGGRGGEKEEGRGEEMGCRRKGEGATWLWGEGKCPWKGGTSFPPLRALLQITMYFLQ